MTTHNDNDNDASPEVDTPFLTRRSVLAALGMAAAAACAPKHSAPAAKRSVARSTTEAPIPTTPLSDGPARFVASGPSASNAVALTFHVNGDPSVCQQLFAEANRLHVPLTLFLVGNWAQANPALVSQLNRDGHDLANHTLTHPTLGLLGASAVEAQIVGCRDILRAETGSPGRWFRPSGMETPTPLVLAAAARAGYDTVVGYSVDPRDYQDPGAASVSERVRNALGPGAIVSLHTSHAGTVDAFGDIVSGIRNAGLKPQTLSTLLA